MSVNRSSSAFGEAQQGSAQFVLPHDFNEAQFDELLMWAEKNRVSDLTIQSGDYVTAQIQGLWQCITPRRLEHNEIEYIISLKYGDSGAARIDSGEPLDFRMQAVITRDNVLGFRANATRCRVGSQQRGISITARSIPGLPTKWETLGIEPEIEEAFFPRYGLILVVGTTGSGKSTLMASGNRRRLETPGKPVKIGTFEDPTEYTFGDLGLGVMPLVSQVEIGVGSDLRHFSQAGPNAMRRKFDVIVMGEMRDMDSIRAGLEMAESGHAVLATLHVDTPAQAVDRIVSFFPEIEQPAVASKLRGALKLVVAQKLSTNTKGTRTAFRSWIVFDREVKDQLGATPFHNWQPLLTGITSQRNASFEARALPALCEGLIDFQAFYEVCGMTASEARAYCAMRGVAVVETPGASALGPQASSAPRVIAPKAGVELRMLDALRRDRLSLEQFCLLTGLSEHEALLYRQEESLSAGNVD